jgi:hypothetical protein
LFGFDTLVVVCSVWLLLKSVVVCEVESAVIYIVRPWQYVVSVVTAVQYMLYKALGWFVVRGVPQGPSRTTTCQCCYCVIITVGM